MEQVEKQSDSKQPPEASNETPRIGEWVEQPNGDQVMLVKPVPINDPLCQHEWQYIFTDSEGFKNYRCNKCPFGKRVGNNG